MERLEKKEDVLYTNNKADMPIEERVFFTQGVVARLEDFREATTEEIAQWEALKAKQEEEQRAMMGEIEEMNV
jgi:hypothetical protein